MRRWRPCIDFLPLLANIPFVPLALPLVLLFFIRPYSSSAGPSPSSSGLTLSAPPPALSLIPLFPIPFILILFP